MNQNSVIFKGKKNGIIVLLDDKIPFEQLIINFESKVIQARDFFTGSKISISFKGRVLTDLEETELLDIISTKSGIDISFINNEESLVSLENKQTIDKHKNTLDDISFDYLENKTLYHKSSIRSGQSVKYHGSVVIIGDVNPGGEVVAEGNITILGSLKGFVHAGCKGNNMCFITAYNFQPTQLRISDIITYIPKEIAKKNKAKFNPSLAYIEQGQIYIEPLT